MKYIKKLILLILFSLAYNVQAQHILSNNLVPNPSFEIYTSCPSSQGDIYKASGWFNGCSWNPDYYNSCAIINNPTFGTPISQANNFQVPKTGDAYAGIHIYSGNNNFREYIAIKMSDSLIKNHKYCAKFYTSFGATSHALDLMGVYFSTDSLICNNNGTLFNKTPQICNPYGNVLIDTLNWMKISGSFISTGDEKYLYIGDFYPDSQNTIVSFNLNFPNTICYYYIDDVSLCECSFDINLGADTSLCEGENIILNPMLPNATYTWQDSSHAATYEVKQPGTYWVRAYVAEYDITTTDTIVITAGDDSFCNPPLTIPNIITPNGDSQNDNFVLPNAENYDIALQIYNRWGTLIYETTSYQNDFSCKDCADGVYYYVLKAKSIRNGREKEYKGSLTIING
jgi:gliding motility-associated-like protein